MSLSAVITGDIVGSTGLQKPVLRKLLKEFSGILSTHSYEFYRGDSFQVYLPEASLALTVVLQLRIAAIKIASAATPASDVRASIGLGKVKQPVNFLRTATDEAFVLSGRAFDGLKVPLRLLITAPPQFETANTGLQLTAEFADYILQRLTVKQAAVLWELLKSRTQKETARRLRKSQATVHQHLQAAGWPQLESLLLHYRLLTESLIL